VILDWHFYALAIPAVLMVLVGAKLPGDAFA